MRYLAVWYDEVNDVDLDRIIQGNTPEAAVANNLSYTNGLTFELYPLEDSILVAREFVRR